MSTNQDLQIGSIANTISTIPSIIPVVDTIRRSTKTYGHEIGLSCAFRQWRATHSHCSLIHGYALSFKFVFECHGLDEKNWVADFGNLRELKAALQEAFDHKTVVASDDPELEWFAEAAKRGILDLTVLPAVGCEKFAEHAFHLAQRIIKEKYGPRVWVVSCEVAEHGANSAIYEQRPVSRGF